jgi:hypothetical protein
MVEPDEVTPVEYEAPGAQSFLRPAIRAGTGRESCGRQKLAGSEPTGSGFWLFPFSASTTTTTIVLEQRHILQGAQLTVLITGDVNVSGWRTPAD